VVQRVAAKSGLKAKQYLAEISRTTSRKGAESSSFTLKIRIGDLVTLDYCPIEVFVVAEIEAFVDTRAPK
jgi:hypothetical protein